MSLKSALESLSEAVSAAPGVGPPCPPKGPWSFFVRAWRPASGWMIVLLLLRATIVPLVQLIRGDAVETVDWTAISLLASALFISRTYERAQGIA